MRSWGWLVQDAGDGAGELGDGERLLDVAIGERGAEAGGDVAQIETAQENDGDGGPGTAQSAKGFFAVHDGHKHVEQDRTDFRMPLQLLQRFQAMACGEGPETLDLEHHGGGRAERDVVIDDEDDLAVWMRGCLPDGRNRICARRRRCREGGGMSDGQRGDGVHISFMSRKEPDQMGKTTDIGWGDLRETDGAGGREF